MAATINHAQAAFPNKSAAAITQSCVMADVALVVLLVVALFVVAIPQGMGLQLAVLVV